MFLVNNLEGKILLILLSTEGTSTGAAVFVCVLNKSTTSYGHVVSDFLMHIKNKITIRSQSH